MAYVQGGAGAQAGGKAKGSLTTIETSKAACKKKISKGKNCAVLKTSTAVKAVSPAEEWITASNIGLGEIGSQHIENETISSADLATGAVTIDIMKLPSLRASVTDLVEEDNNVAKPLALNPCSPPWNTTLVPCGVFDTSTTTPGYSFGPCVSQFFDASGVSCMRVPEAGFYTIQADAIWATGDPGTRTLLLEVLGEGDSYNAPDGYQHFCGAGCGLSVGALPTNQLGDPTQTVRQTVYLEKGQAFMLGVDARNTGGGTTVSVDLVVTLNPS
ncbi:hypothetical protein [Nocardioides sp.]|uniref:hypothetical protein n=1 Tax=Nocardioides sp. TaxID=35761 RepID=UPI0035693F18